MGMRRFMKAGASVGLACALLCGGAAFGKEPLRENDTIVFLGDSITAAALRPDGYITLTSQAIAKAYPDLNIQVVGAGRSGHKVPDCRKRLDRDVLQKNPTIVMIYIGINDVWHWTHPDVVARGKKGTTPEAFESGLNDMIKRINGAGARVILCTPTMIGEKPDGSNPTDKMLDEYAEISRRVAKETGSQLLDLRKAFVSYLKEHNPENAEKGILTTDGVHMNDRGNLLLSAQVLEALNVPVPVAPSAPAVSRPNILLIMADDQAKHALGCYGNKDIRTPALDRLAGEGMRFNHALTPNSFCTPSRAVVLTGKYSHKNGVLRLNKPFDGSQQTFPKLLQAAGYETSVFGKWHLLTRPTGFDYYCVMKMQGMVTDPMVFEPRHDWVVWSKETRKNKTYNKGGRIIKGYNNEVLTTEAINWLKEKRDPNRPFCLLLHPKPPHAPYQPPKKYEDFLKDVVIPEPATLLDDYKGRAPETIQNKMASSRIILAPSFKTLRRQLEKDNPGITRDELTRAMYQEYIKGYYRLVKSVNDNVGRVLDYLKESGLEKNTLVLFTSDQGFSLGEHGMYNKMWMYEPSLHQPLLVRFPGVIKAGTVHESMVNHVDLAPTLLDYAGLPVPEDIQGYSLRPILEGKAEKVRDASYYHFYEAGKSLPEMVGVRTDRYKLIHYPGMDESSQWELFDLEKDPDEMNNLYNNPESAEIVKRMKAELRSLIKALEDPVAVPAL